MKGARGEIITWPSGLSIGALILSSIPFYPYTAIIALVMVIVAIVIAVRRPRLYATIRRPPTSPRSLAQVDTWHANLPNAAQEVAEVRARLETALEKLDRQVEQGWESYQIALPYGYERHELLVLTKGQAMVYVKVYNIGTDLLIGWEGYLNWRCWTETAPTASCVQNGERVVFKSVTPALYVPGWSDLSDLTALMESVHVRVVEVVRLLVVERDIKAEIDFSILRGDRSAALNKETARRSTGSSSKEAGGWRKLLGASKTT
ncbi:hypothetical protein DBR17_15775 [Sphingomonas sp. HMWF008]|nr:hypothetical protein DBR17_15775 [Sphingomonas sp. HMWF008]